MSFISKYIFILLLLSTYIISVERGFDVVDNDNLDVMRKEYRVALVIGNRDYLFVNNLKNPINDARDMADILRKKGFDIIGGKALENASQEEIKRAKLEFYYKLKTRGGVGLFFYAGHGVEIDNKNYLIPVNSRIPNEIDEDKAIPLQSIVTIMEKANNRFNMIILDACRSNPNKRGGGGLAPLNTANGIFVSYSTSPGKTAEDGDGRNGLFTKYLKYYINKEGWEITKVFKAVGKSVKKEAEKKKRKQTPWISLSMYGDFYFTLPKGDSRGNVDEENKMVTPNFITIPSNVKIEVEGRGEWYKGMRFEKGVYTIKLTKRGYKSKRIRVNLTASQKFHFNLEKISNNNKWINPSKHTCINSGGKFEKGVCKANWNNAKRICYKNGGRLPYIKELEKIVVNCGGENSPRYKSCYQQKYGFKDSIEYWSDTSQKNMIFNAKTIYFNDANIYSQSKETDYIVGIKCIRLK